MLLLLVKLQIQKHQRHLFVVFRKAIHLQADLSLSLHCYFRAVGQAEGTQRPKMQSLTRNSKASHEEPRKTEASLEHL